MDCLIGVVYTYSWFSNLETLICVCFLICQGLLQGGTSMPGFWLPKLGDNALIEGFSLAQGMKSRIFLKSRLTYEASTWGVSPRYNLHCREGLFALAEMLINTKKDGLAWWSPTCASWVWMSLGTTLRHVEPWVWSYLPMSQSNYSMKQVELGGLDWKHKPSTTFKAQWIWLNGLVQRWKSGLARWRQCSQCGDRQCSGPTTRGCDLTLSHPFGYHVPGGAAIHIQALQMARRSGWVSYIHRCLRSWTWGLSCFRMVSLIFIAYL